MQTRAVDLHNDYVVKPVRLNQLLDRIGLHCRLDWIYETTDDGHPDQESTMPMATRVASLPAELRQELIRLARIGYASGLRARLDTLESDHLASSEVIGQMRDLARRFQFGRLITLLEQAP